MAGAFVLLSVAAVQAQPAPQAEAPEPIADVTIDINQDFVPDRLGAHVTVAGRASVASGVFASDRLWIAIQDSSAGLVVAAPNLTTPVAVGDSVIATGILAQVAGLTQLTEARYTVVPGRPRPPAAQPIRVGLAPLEAYEGRLVSLKGYVVGKSSVEAGTYINLLDEQAMLTVFVFSEHRERTLLDAVEIGEYLTVRGLVGQFDRTPPYDAVYQLYPLRRADVRMAGLPSRYYRNGVLGVAVVLLGVLAWAHALRRQVRKRVAELHASEARYKVLFDNAGDAVLLHESEGQIVEFNRVARDQLGYVPAALRRMNLADLTPPDQREKLRAHLAALEERPDALVEVEWQTSEDTVEPFELHTHRLTLEGRTMLVTIARNVARRKAYEQGLINARREAEELARSKTTFLANMSHEIRTPLTSVIGFAQVLSEEVSGEQRELVHMIEAGGRRLLDTLNSVLDLARLDARQTLLIPDEIDVVEEIEGCLRMFTVQADDKGLDLRLHTSLASLNVVHDAKALNRIIVNLVGNAVKFTAEGHVHVHLARVGELVEIRVEDTGIGIDAEFLPSLFEEFQQESSGLARTHEGSGLGLAITRRLVHLMGGRITVESRKGEGTTFTVTLPLVPAMATPARAA